MSPDETRHHLDQAVLLVEEAGKIAAGYFRRRIDVHDKSGGSYFDPVTAADREVEQFLRAELRSRYPGYGILGEEEGEEGRGADRCWMIDPIDGTRAFITGMPAWGILLGLTENGAPIVGTMHQPYIGETFQGALGAGAHLRHAGAVIEIAARTGVALADAVLYSTHPEMFVADEERAAFERVSAASRMTRFGGDCYSYCLLAMGQIDLVVESGLQPYDIVPLVPIIEAAGGVVTDARGASASPGGFIVAAGSPELHEQALAAIKL
jgi:histidinol phosphatase-like enzyme (inositol monophosphatase family)